MQQIRDESEAHAFRVMLEAAMARVLAEATRARETYPNILTQKEGTSVPASVIRNCITKGAFAELRAACVRRGGDLTGDFLDLEREIDDFAAVSAPYEHRNQARRSGRTAHPDRNDGGRSAPEGLRAVFRIDAA